MKKKVVITLSVVICLVIGGVFLTRLNTVGTTTNTPFVDNTNYGGLTDEPNSLSIEYMRKQEYPGSDITIEQTLPDGSNYKRYIASYKSDGLKIFALLTVPKGEKPTRGWPVIIFNHGYIPPTQYRTTEKYLAYTDAFSRNGYIVFKSDFRGNGNSEGQPSYPEYSPSYTIDILNAISSIKKYQDADPNNIGMWGHSMGGSITFRSLVISKDIKAAEIWAGVVGTFQDLAQYHHARSTAHPQTQQLPYSGESTGRTNGRTQLTQEYGDINVNPGFWASIDPMTFINDITAPIQIQHGTNDTEVPYTLSVNLDKALINAGKTVTFFSYQGDNHNLSSNLTTALDRSVQFFDKYLKN